MHNIVLLLINTTSGSIKMFLKHVSPFEIFVMQLTYVDLVIQDAAV